MDNSELKRALELYRTGKIDQAADLLHIEDNHSHESLIGASKSSRKSPAKSPKKSSRKSPYKASVEPTNKASVESTNKASNAPKRSYNTMVLDTTHPTISKSVNLTKDLVPFQPKLPIFFPEIQPNQTLQPIQPIQPNQTLQTLPNKNLNTHANSQPKMVASDEKVLGQNLPREIEAGMLQWLQIDGDLDKLRQIKRDLDEQKKALEEQIKSFMEKWEIPEIGPNQEIGLEFKVKEVKQGFTKALVTETLTKMFNTVECEKILGVMESQRSVTEKTCLKLNKPKKPRAKNRASA